MYKLKMYLNRGRNFANNQLRPDKKVLSTLMIYATDLCDSGCKHCLIWAKRPVKYLPKEDIVKIMQSKCVTRDTTVGLEGGEFLLHPQAPEILEWFTRNHPNFDLLSNCLKPDSLIEAVKKFTPRRLYVSLDGDQETYKNMRGKDGHDGVIRVIEALHNVLPVSVMFTLSPYNDLDDLHYVSDVCRKYAIDMRVGLYTNIPFFDTIHDAQYNYFGSLKQDTTKLNVTSVDRKREESRRGTEHFSGKELDMAGLSIPRIREMVEGFGENYDYLKLYSRWLNRQVNYKCFSILDSLVVLPNGDVPICQSLDLKLGNIYRSSLDEIFNGENSIHEQQHHCNNCNGCWLSFHRKYDVALYRNFEKYLGKKLTGKILGYHSGHPVKPFSKVG
jgi:MoaA/NifB/PqqE/SkfB family radical SAM enzyme